MSHLCDGRELTCASCQALARRLDTVRAAMTTDDELDDIKRARVWAQIEDKLADAAPVRRSRRSGVIAIAAVAAAAAVYLGVMPRRDGQHTLAVPVDTVVTSRLGPHTSASIVGPARLEILGATGDATAVRLHSGTLLAEFAGDPGRSLRIEAPGATIDVVGTLFAVTAHDDTTCTSVAHGRVRVTTRSGAVYVASGQRHCTGDSIRPIADDMRIALARHATRTEHTLASADRPPASPAALPTSDPPAPPSDPSDAEATAATRATTTTATAIASASPVAPPPSTASSVTAPPQPPAQSATTPSASPSTRPSSTLSATTTTRPSTPPATSAPARPQAGSSTAPEPSTTAPASTSVPPTTTSPVIGDSPPHGPSTTTVTAAALPPRSELAESSAPPVRDAQRPAEPISPRLTPEELYRTAETALAARDSSAADRALAALIAEYPSSQLIDQALYERARIAYQQRAWPAARSHLARLAAIRATLLAEPGHYLRCRIAVEASEPSAAGCLTDYRAAYPRSPHDLDALALLARLAHARAGCAGAAKLVDELVQSYPRTTFAATWRARCPEPR